MFLAGGLVRRLEGMSDALRGCLSFSQLVSELNQQLYEGIEMLISKCRTERRRESNAV